jgi:hypothetical protein
VAARRWQAAARHVEIWYTKWTVGSGARAPGARDTALPEGWESG